MHSTYAVMKEAWKRWEYDIKNNNSFHVRESRNQNKMLKGYCNFYNILLVVPMTIEFLKWKNIVIKNIKVDTFNLLSAYHHHWDHLHIHLKILMIYKPIKDHRFKTWKKTFWSLMMRNFWIVYKGNFLQKIFYSPSLFPLQFPSHEHHHHQCHQVTRSLLSLLLPSS